MKCPNCNQEIRDDSQFCEYCGTRQPNNHRILIVAPRALLSSNKVIIKANNVKVAEIHFNDTMFYETTEERVIFQFEVYHILGTNPSCICVWDTSTHASVIELKFMSLTEKLTANIH